MKSKVSILLVALLLSAPLSAAFAADTQHFDLLKAMSVADYRATGLEHLSDAQVKALSAWFANYMQQHGKDCAPAALAAPAAAPPAEAQAATVPVSKPVANPDRIVSRLDGDFTGWSGSTRFKLENGQVWQQNDDSILSIASIPHPRVTITKGAFNTYYLHVDGVMNTVYVRRIRP